jgi:hypothetical protein
MRTTANERKSMREVVWGIIWPGLLFAAGMGFFTYINRK